MYSCIPGSLKNLQIDPAFYLSILPFQLPKSISQCFYNFLTDSHIAINSEPIGHFANSV